ncbi:MAG: hypothetical protein KF799_15910 [Bdellovibrionales bacterium]|nr:hypothetical protein [Bdellovibrionales bacterium]
MYTFTKFALGFLLLISGHTFAQTRSSAGSGGDKGFYLEETFFPVYVNKNDTRSVTTSPGVATESGLGYDFRTTIGYTFFGQALLGFTYNLYALNTKRAYVSGGDSGLDETTSRSEYGPTIGYLHGGFRFLATLFLSGSQTVATKNADNTGITGDISIKTKEMSGFQITAGYTFGMFSNVEVGPSLVYRTVSYKKQSKTNNLNASENYSDASLFSKAQDATLSPMVTLLIRY